MDLRRLHATWYHQWTYDQLDHPVTDQVSPPTMEIDLRIDIDNPIPRPVVRHHLRKLCLEMMRQLDRDIYVATFVDDVLAGRASSKQLDDYVYAWHNLRTEDSRAQLPLHTFLGLTFEEYARITENPDAIDAIIYLKNRGLEYD